MIYQYEKFNLIKIAVSFSLLLSMLNLTTVKAIENMILLRNDQLTFQSFGQDDDNYFVVNDISSLCFSFSDNYTNLNLNGNLKIDLAGVVEAISSDTCSGFVGFYEGELEDGNPLYVNLTYSDNKMLATLTIGCMGNEWFGSTYFGETSDNIKKIDDAFSKAIISVNQLNTKQTNRLNIDNLQQSLEITSVDADIRLKGSATASQGGRLSIYHANELSPQGTMNTTAKVNTNRSGVRSYLAGEGYNTTSIYIVPVQFDISIKSSDSKLVSVTNAYLPQNKKTTFTLPVPYVNSSGSISFSNISIVTSSTVLTTGYSSGASDENQFTWVLKKTGGWNQTEFDGDSSSSKGMGAKVSFTYQGTVSSTVTKSLTCTGKIKYNVIYYPDPDSDTQRTITVSTSQMSKTTSVKIVP